MKRNLGFAGRAIGFFLIFAVCYHAYCKWITPKFYTDMDWPATTTCSGFYELEKDSADVLFLGSSHGVTSFVPQELYDRYGITSYNLSTDEQSVVTSYYWLKEALRRQSPRAVVLECYFCFPYYVDEPLNSSETATRKAFDFMKWSPVKAEAVETICELDEKQDVWSYYFPHLRYHERWISEGFDRNDYTYRTMAGRSELKGYSPLRFYLGEAGEGFVPHDMESDAGYAEMAPLMREYLDKIRDLCREEDISLILTITPAVSANIEMCRTVQAYAEENGCDFISFNEQGVYGQMGYVMAEDNCDDGHPNLWGAVKITDYMGSVLSGQFGIAGRTAKQWEETKADYEFIADACGVIHTGEIESFLARLDHEQYAVVITYQGDSCTLEESAVEALRQLGLSADLAGQSWCNYLAVLADGQVLTEQLACGEIAYQCALEGGQLPLYAVGGRSDAGGYYCEVGIDGEIYRNENGGLNVFLYNLRNRRLVDSRQYDA